MDYESLIADLQKISQMNSISHYKRDVCAAAATAISTLQIENQALRNSANGFKAENEKLLYKIEDARLEGYAKGIGEMSEENAKLRAELEKVKRALAMMWFAYVNSDKESPHSYETEALEEAECLLGPWEECMPKFLRCGQKED